MSKSLRDYTKAIYGFDHVIRAVPASAWDAASPCEKWTARELAGHAMGVVEMVGARAAGRPPAHDYMNAPGPVAGDDPYGAWSAIRDSTLEALDQQGALQRTTRTPMGERTVDEFLGFIVADLLIHTWDLARAVGGDEQLAPDLVAHAFANLAPRAPDLPATGNFKPAVSVGADASLQAQLLGITGRQP